MAERLFRQAALPDIGLIDVHVNVVPRGMQSLKGFYDAVNLDQLLGVPAAGWPARLGGCLTPPSGIDLLDASLALREQCAELAADQGRWRALLRFDAGTGKRPGSGHAARLAPVLDVVDRRRSKTREGRVARAVRDEPGLLAGFAGVKLMPQHTGLPADDVLQLIEAAELPILVHAGVFCPVRWLEAELLPRFGGKVILAHLGSWPCSADDLSQAVQLAERDERIHLETSGANIGNFIRHAATHVPHKLLFGSNTPMCEYTVQWQHIGESVHDDANVHAIAHGNAERLFPHLHDTAGVPGAASNGMRDTPEYKEGPSA